MKSNVLAALLVFVIVVLGGGEGYQYWSAWHEAGVQEASRAKELKAYNDCMHDRSDKFGVAFKPWYRGLSRWEHGLRRDLPKIRSLDALKARLVKRGNGYTNADPAFEAFFATRCTLGPVPVATAHRTQHHTQTYKV